MPRAEGERPVGAMETEPAKANWSGVADFATLTAGSISFPGAAELSVVAAG